MTVGELKKILKMNAGLSDEAIVATHEAKEISVVIPEIFGKQQFLVIGPGRKAVTEVAFKRYQQRLRDLGRAPREFGPVIQKWVAKSGEEMVSLTKIGIADASARAAAAKQAKARGGGAE